MKKTIWQKFFTWLWKLAFKIGVILFGVTIVQVFVLKFVDPPFTVNVAWEWAESVIHDHPKNRPVYTFKPMNDISPHLRRAVMAAEDQRFLAHNGFDFNEIRHAAKTLITKKKIRGASTISMQTARSVFLLSSRSVFRKLAEVYYTVLIELMWDKHRILELYLNTVDWGTHIMGAEAAAQKYFSKNARDLSREQAALMTAILPSPHRWSADRPTPYLRKRQKQIMKDMHKMPLL